MLEINGWRTAYEFPGKMSRPIFSLDGQLLAVSPSSVGPAHLLEAATGQELTQVKLHDFFGASLALHPSGKVVAEGGNGKIRLWSTEDSSLLYDGLIRENLSFMEMALDPDSHLLAASMMIYRHKRFYIDLWNTTDGRFLFTLEGHTWSVLSLAFSPNGRFLVSGSDDQTVRLWDYAGGQEICCLKPCQGKSREWSLLQMDIHL